MKNPKTVLTATFLLILMGGSTNAFSQNVDLAVTLSASPDPVEIGDDLTYTITVTNHGPVTATGIILTDPIPVAADFVSVSPATCSNASDMVTCDLPDLANGANAVVTIVVKPRTRGTLTNTATVTANENDENPANNSATLDTMVNAKGGGVGGGGCRLTGTNGEIKTGWALIFLAITLFYLFPRGLRSSTPVQK